MNRAHYSEIKTIGQLRLERMRIRERLTVAEENIEDDVYEISGMFTFDGIINMLFPRRSDKVGSILAAAYSAYDLVSSIIGLLRSKQRRRRC